MALFCALLPANIELDAKRKVQNLGLYASDVIALNVFVLFRSKILNFKASETIFFIFHNVAAYRTPKRQLYFQSRSLNTKLVAKLH